MNGFNLKKASIVLGAVLSISLIALIIFGRASINTFIMSNKTQTKLSDDNVQSGFVVSTDEYMYFCNPADDNKIYKIKADGTEKVKVSDDSTNTLILADNWIYYSNNSDSGKLYKIDIDGSHRTEITKDTVNYIKISTSGIYYSNSNDGGKLYRIGFSSKKAIKLSDEAVSNINIVDNAIIYRSGAQKIIKINSDGTNPTEIENDKVSFAKVDVDGKIYYSLQSDNRSLYSINQSGGSGSKILKTTTFNAETLGEWIYFINNEGDNPNIYASFIYRVKKDGTDLQRLSSEAADGFCISKDKLFYKALDNKDQIYSINLDGAQRKALEGKTIANSVITICRALKDQVDFDISDKKMAEVYKKAAEVLAAITKPDMSQLEKELSIHDYLVKNVKYDYEVIDALNNNFVVNLDSHDAYNVLINGKGVCDGFAWTTKLMLGMCGIDSDIVIGTANVTDEDKKDSRTIYHAWNSVKIDGEYYQLDVTWDENIYEQWGMMSYKYFNVSDKLMFKDHKWIDSYYTKCTSTKYNFFSNIEAAARDGAYIYYTNGSDKYKLYSIKIDGSENKKMNEHRSLFMSASAGWVYYSDYDDGGALYKISADGKNKTKLLSDWCINIEVKDGYVEYLTHSDGKKHKIKI